MAQLIHLMEDLKCLRIDLVNARTKAQTVQLMAEIEEVKAAIQLHKG